MPRFAQAGQVLALSVLWLFLGGCGPGVTDSKADQTATDFANKIQVELISLAPFTGDKARLLLKVTNISKRDIVRAKALVHATDASGKSLGSKSTYLIHGQKGGLAAGASVEEDAIIDVSDKTKVVGMTFEIQDIRYKD
jgi:hypothetical protein